MGVSVVVISDVEEHNESVNAALRNAEHATHCRRITITEDLAAAITRFEPELILLFDTGNQKDLTQCLQLCNRSQAQIPLLLVAKEVDETRISEAMRAGARDVVSLDNLMRLQSVAQRELRAHRLEKSLGRVMDSAKQFKSELHSLKQVSVEAIADVQEGIIVNVNPAWLELFGYGEDADLVGHPIMDICSKADQPALKGGIVACLRGKWQDENLSIGGLDSSSSEFHVSFCLENIVYDGDPAVRMLVKPDLSEPKTPVSLLEKAIQRDQPTGLYTRQHFLDCAEKRLSNPPNGGVRALAYLRIDRFARAANEIGILGTEDVIAQFAQLLRNFIQPTDIYGRFGGTMFTILLERGNMADVEAWAERYLAQITNTVFEFEQRSTVLACSIGICELDNSDAVFTPQLIEAERACRAARQKGGNRIEFSESSGASREVRQDDSIWVPRIRDALMENRFRLEHQPIAGLHHEIGNAYDTLVRMLDEEDNTILPSEFMPVAERKGMTKSIDRWVIGASFLFCLTNDAELIFIRLSLDSLLDESLPDWLEMQLDRSGVTARRICFEVDEAIVSGHLIQTQNLSTRLHELGFRFAIEHFGTSPDSSQLLTRIELEIVKIDGSLMQGLHKNTETQSVVKALAQQASDAGIETVAERVQDANTMAVLWQLGVSYMQGNYVQKGDIVLEDASLSTVTTRALQLQV